MSGESQAVLARLAALEARVAALESGGGATSSSSSSSGGIKQEDPLPEHLLEKEWADKVIQKDPKSWKGPTQVGRRYSIAPSKWLLAQASMLEWKAQKGREEVPVRVNNKGKPWHESDTFEAKLCRAWAVRAEAREAKRPPEPENDAGDEIPF